MNAVVSRALAKAQTQLGVHEVGTSNTGPQVDRYLASVGLEPGQPWCAAFVYFCISSVTGAAAVPFLRSGYTPAISAWAESLDLLERDPEVGDAFLLYRPNGKARHIGFVTKVGKTSFLTPCFWTVEGNTNLGGSPEGVGVFARTRILTDAYRFARWGRLCDPAPVGTWDLTISGHPVAELLLIGERAWCPVRAWGEFLGFKVEWDALEQAVSFDEKLLDADVSLVGGKAYAPVRDLAAAAGLVVQSVAGGVVAVERP